MCRYVASSLAPSVKSSSSSDPSTLSKALALAAGDLGEVGLKIFFLNEPVFADFPVR